MNLFKKNVLLSIIVPCFNSKNSIDKVLSSIINQKIKRSIYEIIICNDSNDDNYLKKVFKYKLKANIKVIDTNTKVHCPGNSRQVGLDNASGKFVTFIDHDDEFIKGSLKPIIEYILKKSSTNPVICTSFIRETKNEENVIDNYLLYSFLHGKFYLKDFLCKYNISFKKNMKAYEDIYFNNQILNKLYEKNIYEFDFTDIKCYKWNFNLYSISNNNSNRGYLHDNFDDFIIAASSPFLKNYSDINERQVLTTLIRICFYYQAAKYNNKDKDYQDNYLSIINYYKLIKDSYNINYKYIKNYIKNIWDIVNEIKEETILLEGDFIEECPLLKFIMKLENNS